MGKEECPSYTGISDITGKLIEIKHATEVDMFFIEEMMRKHNLEVSDLHYSQFVIATENGKLVGLGRLKKINKPHEIGSVTIVEEKKGSGIGSYIAKHLLDMSPVKMICIDRDLKDIFKGFGFTEMKECPKELSDNLDKVCKGRTSEMIIMIYEKK
ncbi:MAG: GNAT family N-acetyltransferase [Thermodesulfovibrionales bacterium]